MSEIIQAAEIVRQWPKGLSPKITIEFVQQILLRDPLRQKIGETAINALLNGEAAVVPLEPKGLKGLGINLFRLEYDRSSDGVEVYQLLNDVRLDKKDSE